jgi:hypothetical protein
VAECRRVLRHTPEEEAKWLSCGNVGGQGIGRALLVAGHQGTVVTLGGSGVCLAESESSSAEYPLSAWPQPVPV